MIETVKRERYSYAEYLGLTENLLAQGRTTGTNHSEKYIEFTQLNLQRMHRIGKTLHLLPELVQAAQGLRGNYTWTVLAEAWCGDVAQNLPVLAAIAALNPGIDLQIILRDDNLDLIDQHLTDGGRGIPKLIVTDSVTGKVVTTWGPRPEPAQQMVRDYKALAVKPPYDEFVVELQKWYAQDKTITLQREFINLLAGI